MEYKNKFKLYLIRHAESEFNLAQFKYGGDKAASSAKYENIDLKYDPRLLDSPITEQGVEQCKQPAMEIKKLNIKLVIVSPLQRTLDTCHEVLRQCQIKPKVIVDPLFREHLQSSCDIGSKIQESQDKYSYFDFSFLEKYPNKLLWSLYELWNQEKKEEILKYIKEKCEDKGVQFNQQGHFELLQYMKDYYPKFLEKTSDTIERSQKQKERVLELAEKYDIQENEGILVVGHAQNLKAFTANQFSLDKETNDQQIIDGYHLKNCELIEFNFEK